MVESDSFEDNCSLEELDQLNQLIALLAIEGATEDERVDVENSIASLFGKDFFEYALFSDSEHKYVARPAIYIEGSYDAQLCRSWIKKKWDATRDFCKKHKKAIIIGAIVVVAVAVVVVTAVAISTSAASAAGAAAGGALTSTDNSTGTSPDSTGNRGSYSETKEESSNESFISSLQNQVSTFKETVAQEQFAANNESSGISIEENGRIVGSLFTHKAVDAVTTNLAQKSSIADELRDLGIDSQYPIPRWLQTYPESSTIMPHPTTDLAFSTNYTATYAGEYDVNMLSYQARGNLALSSGYYSQAIQDFSSAITIDPNNPSLYLGEALPISNQEIMSNQ